MNAICSRCGTEKAAFRAVCSRCGQVPIGEGLLVAWLMSDEHLGPDELAEAAHRIRNGEAVSPSAKMRSRARRALGVSFATDPGLGVWQRLGLFAAILFATPLVGWVCWLWWLRDRPRAAWQSFALTLPVSLTFFGLGVYLQFFV